MKILGVDIATSTGFCIAEGDRYETGKWTVGRLKSMSDDGYVQNAILVAQFRQWLWSMIRLHGIEAVAIEEPLRSDLKRNETSTDPNDGFFGSKQKKPITSFATVYRLYALSGAAIAVCHELNVPFRLINQNTWRSKFVGKKSTGETWKEAARRTCRYMGIDAKSDDAADAAGVAFALQVDLKQPRPQVSGQFFQMEAAE